MNTTISLLQQDQFGQTKIVPISVVNDDSAEHKIELLTAEVDKLTTSLEYEKKLRLQAEDKIKELTLKIDELQLNKRTRRTKKELEKYNQRIFRTEIKWVEKSPSRRTYKVI